MTKKMETVVVNSYQKANFIVQGLKKQNRLAFYEKFYSMDDNFYLVVYYVLFYNAVR